MNLVQDDWIAANLPVANAVGLLEHAVKSLDAGTHRWDPQRKLLQRYSQYSQTAVIAGSFINDNGRSAYGASVAFPAPVGVGPTLAVVFPDNPRLPPTMMSLGAVQRIRIAATCALATKHGARESACAATFHGWDEAASLVLESVLACRSFVRIALSGIPKGHREQMIQRLSSPSVQVNLTQSADVLRDGADVTTIFLGSADRAILLNNLTYECGLVNLICRTPCQPADIVQYVGPGQCIVRGEFAPATSRYFRQVSGSEASAGPTQVRLLASMLSTASMIQPDHESSHIVLINAWEPTAEDALLAIELARRMALN